MRIEYVTVGFILLLIVLLVSLALLSNVVPGLNEALGLLQGAAE